RWSVPAEGALTLIFADGKDQYKDNAGEFSVEVYREADISAAAAAPFEDLTNFERDNWNNWQAGPAGHDLYLVDTSTRAVEFITRPKEGANKRGNSSRLTQSFHFFMFEPIFSPVNAL
ncbi:hypothetical protein ABVW88_24060, partial [Enterobacter cloacae subsp. cloacae]